MLQVLYTLTNREIAVLFYVGVFLLYTLKNKEVRNALYSVLIGMLSIKLPLFLAIIFISVNIFIVNLFFGKFDIVKTLIVWCLIVPFPLLLGANKIKENIYFFSNLIKKSINLTVILTFIINTYTFSVIVEIILLPLIVLFSLFSDSSYIVKEEKVKIFSEYVLLFLGFLILIGALNGFVAEPDKLIAINKLYNFFIPVILTILFLPYVYLFALIMEYESLIIRVKIFKREKVSKYQLFLHIFKLCKFNIYKLHRFSKYYSGKRIGGTEEYFTKVIADFKILD